MDIAKAMYLGGKIIYARDKSIDYNSYRELGLRCPVCGEPVHFRLPGARKPHFAHFPGVDPKQVEVCELRAASYGTDIGNGKDNPVEDRGQRLKIFQSHFIEIISNTIPDFYKVVQAAKDSSDCSSFAVVLPDILRYFVKNGKSIVKRYCQLYQDKLTHITTLQKMSSWEAIDFLGIKSSHYLLEELLWYIWYINKSKNLAVNNNDSETLLYLIDTVINIQWVEAYRSIKFTLQASLVQPATKEQKQQWTSGVKVVEPTTKSDVKREGLFGGLNIHTNLTLAILVSSIKKDKIGKTRHHLVMRITNNFPALTILFELGIPVRKTPKSDNNNIKYGSYIMLENKPLMEVAFNTAFKPTITVYKLLSSKAIVKIPGVVLHSDGKIREIPGTEFVIDGTYLDALRLARVRWQAELITDTASGNGWSSWNLVALRLLDQITPPDNETDLGDYFNVNSFEYKALSKSDVFKTIQDVYQEMTGLGLLGDESLRAISDAITQYYLAEERKIGALKVASVSTSENPVGNENTAK